MVNRRVSVTVDADLSPFNRAMLGGVASARSFAHELEAADSRFTNIVQTGLALAPALVPLGAIGIPAVAGLAAQLGATAAAAGVTVIAFQGVGDALKALNDYQIDPTDAHLKKLNQTMDALGPAGELLVRTLQDLRPELQGIQDIAQLGMFPGLTDSIYELRQLEPEVESIVGTIARTLGDLAEAGAEELTTDRWVEFIGFLDHEARPTLTAMAKALGYTVEGLASLMMDFDPLADDFTQGMVRYARSFRDWADGLDETDGFQDFVDYIRDNGPEALETLAALGNALVSLVKAAAPVGAAVLPVIEALADALAAIADSNVGPLLVGVAAGVGTLGRALAIMEAVGLRSGESIVGRILRVDQLKESKTALGGVSKATTELQLAQERLAAASVKARDAQFALIPTADKRAALDEYTKSRAELATATDRVTAAERQRAVAFRTGAAQLGKSAALVGGLALAMSGYADDSGLANTATFALMGTIAGPWGTAIGGGIGLAMDFAAANNDLEQAIRAADQALDTMDLSNMRAQLQALDEQIGRFQEKKDFDWSLNPVKHVTEGWSFVMSHVNDETGRAAEKRRELAEANDDLTAAENALGQAFGEIRAGKYVDDLERLAPILERARPAMEALGITTEDLASAVRDGAIVRLVGQIVDYTQWMDSAAGRTARVADAMRGLDDQMASTQQSATDLKSALDALLDPHLNLVRATDAWTTGLRHLEDDLAKDKDGVALHTQTLKGNSDAAIKNREAVNQRIDLLKQLLGAEADAGASSKELARKLRDQRAALIDAGVAAGISREEMRRYVNQLGLTPKLVETLIRARTDEALAAIRRIKAEIAGIKDKSVRITAYVNQVNASNIRVSGGRDGDPATPQAGGGTVPKTGLPYADRHLYLLADGEEIITNRNGEADRNRAELKAANAGAKLAVVGYESGGTVTIPRQQERPRYLDVSTRQVSQASPSRMTVDLGEIHIRGTLDTAFGPAEIEGVASAVARAEIDADRRFQHVRGGR